MYGHALRRRHVLRDPVTVRHAAGLETVDDITASSPYQWETYSYDRQAVDHFGWSHSNATFKQRYLLIQSTQNGWLKPYEVNGPGPVFLYTGNEGPIETFAANSGLLVDLAADFHALVVFVEHRYYGSSMPFGSASESYANTSTLSLLSSQQALADFAQFIDFMRSDSAFLPCKGNCSTMQVIAFGGSYGGMLAAWLRLKYPAAVSGAIAASAPVWQFTGLTPPDVYSALVTRAFSVVTDKCSAGISRSWGIIANYSQSADGLSELGRIFSPCGGIGQFENVTDALFSFLSLSYSYMAMANYPYEANFLNAMPRYPVDYACTRYFADMPDVAAANETAVLEAVAGIAGVYWNYTDSGPCFNWTAQGPPSLGTADGWGWQSCVRQQLHTASAVHRVSLPASHRSLPCSSAQTEMVMPIGQYPPHDMFWSQPWDLKSAVLSCRQPMPDGFEVTPSPLYVVQQYGGVHLESASRIIFSNGDLDPWSGGGVNDSALNGAYSASNARGVVALLMQGAAHHLDLRGRNDSYDPESVQWVRQQERLYISAWLEGYDTPAAENVSAGLDTKWVVLISVGATLATIVVAAALFHFCKSKDGTLDQTDDALHSGGYASMSG